MKIIIHCSTGGPPYSWDADSINNGIGGSEEAVVYLSAELSALGHDVAVYNRCGWSHRDAHGARWVQQGTGVEPCDIFIAWRDWRLYDIAPEGAKKYLWCHDIPVDPHWDHEAAFRFDRVILLNEHHARLYEAAGCPRHKMFICQNGVDLTQFDQANDGSGAVDRVPGKCIYFSHPHRGLHKLREYWPRIREAVPHATLHAFWWQPEFFLPADESLGIMPMRSLGHKELAREILSSDLFTYPSVFDHEINPISCIKAMVGGALPVVISKGGMRDTLTDCAIQCNEQTFPKNVIWFLQKKDRETEKTVIMWKARARFDWHEIAKKWAYEFECQLIPS